MLINISACHLESTKSERIEMINDGSVGSLHLQLDQRTEAEQKVHTVTLLLNGLRQKHEQQLAEADDAARSQISQITLAGASAEAVSGNAAEATPLAAVSDAHACELSARIEQPAAASSSSDVDQPGPSSADSGDLHNPPIVSEDAQPSACGSGTARAAEAASAAAAYSKQALPMLGHGAQGDVVNKPPAASAMLDGLGLSLDPGGSAAWAEARQELDQGLKAMGAGPKLADCARKDW